MTIRLVDGPQPLSSVALDAQGDVGPWAHSPAQENLQRELLRYTRGEILGRSVLVAGHRGSGKTTLVLQALQQVRRDERGQGRRPLLVRIAGPSLLLEGAQDGSEPPGSAVADDVGRVLERVTMVLVQAVADEVHHEMQRRVKAHRPDMSQQSARELAELAARLRVALEGVPSLAGLRDIWSRAGLLDQGLFGAPDAQGAGVQEVRVLWSLAQASIIPRGKVTRTLGEESSARRTAEGSWKVLTSGRELLNPLLGLMSGSLVGWGLIEQAEANGFVAALVATIVGLATATTLNFSAQRLMESSQDQRFSVELDTSVYSLSLLLPRLVQQLRAIGLAPVFLIDELDKVRHLRGRMRELVRHLKSLVSEDAFFCFVTDRDYYEFLRWSIQSTAYPEEHTYFTDRLYVSYLPADLRVFLSGSLVLDEGSSELETADYVALPSVLLLRSRMHLLDLRREIRTLRGPDGALRLQAGSLCQRRHVLLELAAQAAIEDILAEPAMVELCLRDGYFTQLAVDALYMPIEAWYAGDHHVSLTRDALYQHLIARMDTEAFPAPEGTDVHGLWLSASDQRFLHGALHRLARRLCEPAATWAPLERQPLLTKLSSGHVPEGAFMEDLGEERFRFCFGPLGEDYEREAGA
ncbi:MAG: hypothetical protein H6741_19815 [Alphaproteobacteria bacterium]|nr:hypothetical protein [Alphaproteobacteria bacterium]MCB9794953.1 hypothetical protein [Alphaproteobacteria bacterium]